VKNENCQEIEIAVSKYFGTLRNLIVPNVSWGIGIHECDLLVLTASNYAYEVEIKISKADLIRDAHKRHQHRDYLNRIRQMWFAVPQKLYPVISLIPITSGVLVVDTEDGKVIEARAATVNTNARKFTDEERYKVARLGALRIWNLKAKILKFKLEENSI
jgi:hypothetical protein